MPDYKLKTKPATKQDSLDVLNNSMQVKSFYKGKNYKQTLDYKFEGGAYMPEVVKRLNQYSEDYKKNPATDNNNKVIPHSNYRKDIDSNRFLQRESDDRILDTRAPMQLIDKRIAAQKLTEYFNNNKKDSYKGDFVSMNEYDPIAVKPWQMLTPAQQKERTAKYGTTGTPMDKTKAAAKVNTPVAGIKTAKGIKPYQPKSKADEVYRKQMYDDSLGYYSNGRGREGNFTIRADVPSAVNKTKESIKEEFLDLSRRPRFGKNMQPVSTSVVTEDGSVTGRFNFKKPTQQINKYISPTPPNPPSVAKIKPKQIGIDTDTTSIPTKLDTISTTPMAPSTLTANRSVTKVKYTPSTKPGYENMKEYGTYSKNGDEVDVPKSAVQSKYKNGTKSMNMKDMYAKGSKGIKTKKMTAERFEDSPEDKKADAEAMAKMNKSGKYAAGTGAIKVKPTGPFSGEEIDDAAKATIADKDLESRLDVAAKEDKTKAPTFDIGKIQAKDADMAKVRQHQEKLNRYGANLKVDGMWGEKTEKASRDLYPQYKEQTKTRQPPVSDARMQGLFGSSGKEPVQAKSTGIKTASSATKTASPQYRSAAETSQAWNDLVNKPTGIKTTSKSGLSNFIKTEGDKRPLTTIQKERKTQTAANEEEEVKKIDEQLALRKEDPGVAEAAANNPVPGMGAFAAHISDAANGGKSISPEYREQLEARREQLRPTPKTAKSKSLDGGDAAIYGAEAAGPAIANSIKGGGKYTAIAKAALRFGPGIVDFAKTAYDDKDSTATQYMGSAAKAGIRAGILGTAGSTIARGVSKTARGYNAAANEINTIEAARKEASSGLIAAKAAKAAATSKKGKAAAKVLIAKTSAAVNDADKMRVTKPSSFSSNVSEAFKETGAGRAIEAVKNNPVSKFRRTLKGYNANNEAIDNTAIANKQADAVKSAERNATKTKNVAYDEAVKENKKFNRTQKGIQTKAQKAKDEAFDEATKANKKYNKNQKADDAKYANSTSQKLNEEQIAANKPKTVTQLRAEQDAKDAKAISERTGTRLSIKTKRKAELEAIADAQLQKAETARGVKAAATKQTELDKINEQKYGYKGGRTEEYQSAPASAESDRVARRMNELADAGEKKIVDARVAGYKAKADGTKAKNSVFNEAAEENKTFDKKVDYTNLSRKEQADIAAKKYSLNGKESVSVRTKVTTYNQPKEIKTVKTEARAKKAVKLKTNGKPNSAQRRKKG